jgi:hypothetical protein
MNHPSTAYNPITDLTGVLSRTLEGYRVVVLDGERVISRHTCPDLESGRAMLETVIQPRV